MKKSSLDSNYLMLALFKIDLLDQTYPQEKLAEREQIINNIQQELKEDKKVEIETKEPEKEARDIKIKEIGKTIKNIKDVRVNNTFVNANKESLNKFKKLWNDLDNYTLDRKYGAYVCELIDVAPVAASEDYLVLGHKYDSFVDKGNNNIFDYEKTVKEILGEKVKLVFITDKDWKNYKEEYIKKTKENYKYEIIKEETEKIVIDNSEEQLDNDIIKKANELFDDTKIEIEE
jgi:hypothetical protein